MSMYRKEWDCCGDVSETNGWEPDACPFCPASPSPSTAPEVDERAAFEAKYRGMLDLMPCAENDSYMAYSTYCAWRAWKDRGAALASRPAEVDDEGLPPLPKETAWMVSVSGLYEYYATRRAAEMDRQIYEESVADDPDMEHEEPEPLFTAEQYRQGQRDAVAADRARREKLPANAAEMVAFIGSHFNSMTDDKPDPNDIVYELTVHDLLSAFRWWFEDYELEDEPSHTTNKEK